MVSEPLAGKCYVILTDARSTVDWAHQINELVDVRNPDAKRITIVMDNLNTQAVVSVYETFEAAEARLILEN